jgi:hypothetical protein
MRSFNILRTAAPVLALAFIAACTDAGSPNTGDGGLPTLTEVGFYPLLSAATAAEGTSAVTLSLKQVPGGVELASVQGEIQYDASLLQMSRASLPEGVEGDVEEVSPGHVRFVGTLLPGATEPALLRLEFRGGEKPVSLAREMFSVHIEEVTGGTDLADMTATVRTDQLLFVRSR